MIPGSQLSRFAAAAALAATSGLLGCVGQIKIDADKAYADARKTLDNCLRAQDPFTRSNAIEALADTVGAGAGPAYEAALADESPAVRFAAAMAIGDTRYAPAKARLVRMAEDKQFEPDRRVMPAVVYALYRLGDSTYAGELYPLLFDTEKEVRANAALVMGKMQEPSGIGPLKTRLNDEQDPMVRLQIIESLAMLGDAASALSLEAYTKKTPFLDERLVAIPAMARVRSATASAVLTELLDSRQPPRVRVAAAGALGMLGQFTLSGYMLCREAAENPQAMLERAYGGHRPSNEIEVSSLQRLAAISLGWLGNEAAADTLHTLLSSPDGPVRVAAAMSILRLLPGYQRTLPPAAMTTPPVEQAPVEPAPPPQQAPAPTPPAPAPTVAPSPGPPTPAPPAPAPAEAAPSEAPAYQPPPASQPAEGPPAEPSSKPSAAETKPPSGGWRLHTAGGKD